MVTNYANEMKLKTLIHLLNQFNLDIFGVFWGNSMEKPPDLTWNCAWSLKFWQPPRLWNWYYPTKGLTHECFSNQPLKSLKDLEWLLLQCRLLMGFQDTNTHWPPCCIWFPATYSWAHLEAGCYYHPSADRPMQRRFHLSKQSRKHRPSHESAEHSSAGPELCCCHHHNLDGPMWQQFHLLVSQQKRAW